MEGHKSEKIFRWQWRNREKLMTEKKSNGNRRKEKNEENEDEGRERVAQRRCMDEGRD